MRIENAACDFISDTFIDDGQAGEVKCSTEYKRDDIIYRAHPNYRRLGKWSDWAYVMFPDGRYPCRIICFVDVLGNKSDMRVIFQSAERIFEEGDTVITRGWSMEHKRLGGPMFREASVDTLDGSCFVLNLGIMHEVGVFNEVSVIMTVAEWAEQF